MNYWYGLFDKETWQELLSNGANEDGFRDEIEATVKKMESGDILICYCKGLYTWFNAYEITGECHRSEKRLYEKFSTPNQVPIRVMFRNIKPEDGIPVKNTFNKLRFFAKMENKNRWGSFMRTQPRRMDDTDGEFLMDELKKIEDRLR